MASLNKLQIVIQTRTDRDNVAIGFTAHEASPFWAGWKGCPLGTGGTWGSALDNLIYRANMESGTVYVPADCEICSWPVGMGHSAVKPRVEQDCNDQVRIDRRLAEMRLEIGV